MENLLSGTVQSAAPNLKGFDTDGVVDAKAALEFANAGYSFCLRYLARQDGQQPGDLTYDEADGILSAGLALSAVQHVLSQGWEPSQSLGTEYGTNAAKNAVSIGLPSGMNLWLDLKGLAPGTPDQQIIDYCNAWYDAVLAGGFVPGIYVGSGCGLSGDQLYDLKFQHYWRSLSRDIPSEIPNRGYQMIQNFAESPVPGVEIESDVTQNDLEGGAVLWLKRSPDSEVQIS